MKIGRYVFSLLAVVALAGVRPVAVLAQSDHAQMSSSDHGTQDPRGRAGALVREVRQVTQRFLDVRVAEAEGYQLQFGCVSGPDAGAMGLHFVNGALVGDGEIDVDRPEIVIYEPVSNGRVRLIGADYLVLADAWNAHHAGPPELMGQLFHLFEAPNRFGLPPFYTLHVWAWKDSPTGTFVNWNQNVSCDAFSGQNP
jgi:hypothetical protein